MKFKDCMEIYLNKFLGEMLEKFPEELHKGYLVELIEELLGEFWIDFLKYFLEEI